jgi:hypothetical protein
MSRIKPPTESVGSWRLVAWTTQQGNVLDLSRFSSQPLSFSLGADGEATGSIWGRAFANKFGADFNGSYIHGGKISIDRVSCYEVYFKGEKQDMEGPYVRTLSSATHLERIGVDKIRILGTDGMLEYEIEIESVRAE